MYEIQKDFALSYSHQLAGLPDDHQCARMHGHNAVVRITLAADELDATGFVMDYGDLKPLKTFLDDTLDHRHINDVFDWNPTAENLAYWLFWWASALGWPVKSVGWSETPKTWAVYRP